MATTRHGFTGATTSANADQFYHGGGALGFAAAGGFGAGTLKMQAKRGATWVDVPNMSLTAAGEVSAVLPNGYYRLSLTGATGATLDAHVLHS